MKLMARDRYSIKTTHRTTSGGMYLYLFIDAIKKWAEQVKQVGIGKANIYNQGKGYDNYANHAMFTRIPLQMVFEGSKKVGCAVEICQKSGASAVMCQYDE
ncbi:hypothetical protein ANCDUO_14766 [Ancylostoma duodenale]|uniref:SCP domain-containing protein n=1 Tax=Ancylostoma duodenale TaxID=51022 RepID=A0A0C2CZ21_9BILA|nr:hypothetical protein ANCDUO_14766 [Ancylostoma duodenale]